MQYPKISIITPTFNQVDYIEQTILPVLNQNYPNLEYIILDGGSTDGTVDIIKKYEDDIFYYILILSPLVNNRFKSLKKELLIMKKILYE